MGRKDRKWVKLERMRWRWVKCGQKGEEAIFREKNFAFASLRNFILSDIWSPASRYCFVEQIEIMKSEKDCAIGRLLLDRTSGATQRITNTRSRGTFN